MTQLYLYNPNEEDLPEGVAHSQEAFPTQALAVAKANEFKEEGVGGTVYKVETNKLGSRELLCSMFNQADDAFSDITEFRSFTGKGKKAPKK